MMQYIPLLEEEAFCRKHFNRFLRNVSQNYDDLVMHLHIHISGKRDRKI